MRVLFVCSILLLSNACLAFWGYNDPIELGKKIYYGDMNQKRNLIGECAQLPSQQFGYEQTVHLRPDFAILTEDVTTMNANVGMSSNQPISVVAGVLNYCDVMNPTRDDRFYKAELKFNVLEHNSNKYNLCLHNVNLSMFEWAEFNLTQLDTLEVAGCVDAKVIGDTLNFDLADILLGLYNNENVLNLFTLMPRSNGNNKFINVTLDATLNFTIPELRDVPPRNPIPASDGNDYQDVFPGYTFEHVDTILGSDGILYGRDVYWRESEQTNTKCAMIITDGMPTQAAIHYMVANNHVVREGKDKFEIWKYCDVYITTRPASGSNSPTPNTTVWSWDLSEQADEQAAFIEWVRDGDDEIKIMVLSHDRDSHASQENRRRGLIDIYVEWDGWFTGCSQARNATGECSNRWLAGGTPLPGVPLPACSWIGNPSWCNCTDKLFFATFLEEFKDDSEDGHGVCVWRDLNYQYNYEMFKGIDDPTSPIRQCLAKNKDPMTGNPAPADGYFLDSTYSVTYNYTTCNMIYTSAEKFTTFNPQRATTGVTLTQNVLDMIGYGNNLTHFNTPELRSQALKRRQFKMQDPRGAVFNIPFDNTRVVTDDGLTGPDMYQRYQISNEEGAYTVNGNLVQTYYIDNRGILPYGFVEDWIKWPGLHHLPGQPKDSHLTTLHNPYSWLKKIRLIFINEGFAPASVSI